MAHRRVYGSWAPEGRGKGKRRFAPQGVWRSSGHGQDAEPVVWLAEGPQRPPIPRPQRQEPAGSGRAGRRKDEFHLAELAQEFWGSHLPDVNKKFMSSLVEGIYATVKKTNYAYRPIMALEFSRYLENYLWPNFNQERCTQAYVMSVVMVVNEKWRERVPAWEAFEARPDSFPFFFQRVLDACLSPLEDSKYTMKERTMLLLFLVYCFNSLEVDMIREQLQRLVSLSMWRNLLPSRLEEELQAVPKLKRYWRALQKKERRADETAREKAETDSSFLTNLIQLFFRVLSSIPLEEDE
jgi:intron-binding protein aquarius